jgi:hypothetical protein
MIMRSRFDGCRQCIYPLFFATVAVLRLPRAATPRTLLYASLGRAVMGMWSATSTTPARRCSASAGTGTLELLVATPTHFALILLPSRSRWRRSASTAWSPRCSGAARVRRST